MENINNTQFFTVQKEPELQVRDVLEIVFRAVAKCCCNSYGIND